MLNDKAHIYVEEGFPSLLNLKKKLKSESICTRYEFWRLRVELDNILHNTSVE